MRGRRKAPGYFIGRESQGCQGCRADPYPFMPQGFGGNSLVPAEPRFTSWPFKSLSDLNHKAHMGAQRT